MDIKIPLDIPKENRKTYQRNYELVTHGTGRLMLFAGDQKVEHLNDDFYGEAISPDDNFPEHMFRIASKARIGAFETQFGFIASYGMDYPKVPYIVKVNSKTNLVKTTQKDPISQSWYTHGDVLELRKTSGLNIVGVGYTVYLGSEFESEMLREAASLVYSARYFGLITILWMYPRGKAVKKEKDPHLIAGAAGAGAALGADFVKVNYPVLEKAGKNKIDPSTSSGPQSSAGALREAVAAAGRTKVICAGGEKEEVSVFLQTLYDQIHTGGTSGNATGRNIHQRPMDEAVRFANAISSITFDDKPVEEAMGIYEKVT